MVNTSVGLHNIVHKVPFMVNTSVGLHNIVHKVPLW